MKKDTGTTVRFTGFTIFRFPKYFGCSFAALITSEGCVVLRSYNLPA